MFHTAFYTGSVDQAVLAGLPAGADPVLTINGNNLQVPTSTPNLGLVAGNGVNLTRLQMQSPSLRRTLNPEERPILVAAIPVNTDIFIDRMASPIPLDPGEQLQAWTAEDGAGATRMNVVINLVDKGVTPVMEPIFSLRVTVAQALVAFAWTNGVMVLDQILPVGVYAIVGARFESANLLAFRFVLQNQTPRPGGLGCTTPGGKTLPGQRHGGWGVWGEFDNFTLPTVDFLAAAADAAEIGTLDLVKVG